MEKLFEGADSLYRGKKSCRQQVPISNLSGEEPRVVGLYFSARWCQPCQVFTPELVEWYDRLRGGVAKDNLEIVFISSDEDERQFELHYETMPWLALPYQYKEVKARLVRKFKVHAIPSLILLDGNKSSLITENGKSIVVNDRNGEGFPWKPEKFMDCLPGIFINRHHMKIFWEELKETKEYLGIFFSGQWCQPCQSFSSELISFYEKINAKDPLKFEVVFVSSDKNEFDYIQYTATMPWLAIPFDDERCKRLKQVFHISSIPILVIVNPKTGEVITDKARAMIDVDPEGEDFPWYPKALDLLHEGVVSLVNDCPCLVWFTDGTPEQMEQAKKVMTPFAECYFLKQKDKPNEDGPLKFFYANDSDLSATLREDVLDIPEAFPTLVLIDIPNQRMHICESPELTEQTIGDFLHSFEEQSLPEWKELRNC